MYQPTGYSLKIFKDRYSFTSEESWSEACARVTKQALVPETPEKQRIFDEKFYDILVNNYFVPGGRIWYNSGRHNPNLLNCFVGLKEMDSKYGWGDVSRNMIITSMSGGGIGNDFSDIRPSGSDINGHRGICPGPISLMELLDGSAPPIRSGGGRRVAMLFGLSSRHPDISEFIDSKLVKGKLTNANISIKSLDTTDFIKAVNKNLDWDLNWKGRYKNKIKAKDLWDKIVYNNYHHAEPGFLNWELVEEENTISYLRELLITNPCVPSGTEVLTRIGYQEIQTLVNTEVEVWNGFEWSKVTPKVTGHNRELVTVSLSNGRSLTCTTNHKFVIQKSYKDGDVERVEAKDLQPGMKLIKTEYPVIEEGKSVNSKEAYTQGFISAEGMDGYNHFSIYDPKIMCLPRLSGKASKRDSLRGKTNFIINFKQYNKSFIPFEWNLNSKLNWLSGLFDGDGCELKEGGLQLVSVDERFLLNLQKLLTTVGISSKVVPFKPAGWKPMPDGRGAFKDYYCQESKRICIGAVQIQFLKSLGLKCERLKFEKTPQRDASQFVTVVDVTEAGIADIVYCFTEPKRNLGCFNGIVTGQCGEIPLSEHESCCLGHLVLTRFIKDGELDWHLLGNVIRLGIRFLDNVLSVNYYPLVEQKEIAQKLRRIGLGTTGLADMLVILGFRYGSNQANEFINKLYRFISKAAYESSVMLAAEKGAFPLCNPRKHIETGFVSRMPKKIKALIEENGIRNCAILTAAPTGTVSILSGNISSGIEAIFAPAYERRYWDGSERKMELIFHPLFKQFLEEDKPTDKFVSARDLSVKDHLEVQRIIQLHTDNAVSKTVNISEDYSIEELSKTWLEYLPYLKGTTFYRENTRGFVNSKGELEPPPLTAIPIEEAIERFNEAKEGTEEQKCKSGVCSL